MKLERPLGNAVRDLVAKYMAIREEARTFGRNYVSFLRHCVFVHQLCDGKWALIEEELKMQGKGGVIGKATFYRFLRRWEAYREEVGLSFTDDELLKVLLELNLKSPEGLTEFLRDAHVVKRNSQTDHDPIAYKKKKEQGQLELNFTAGIIRKMIGSKGFTDAAFARYKPEDIKLARAKAAEFIALCDEALAVVEVES